MLIVGELAGIQDYLFDVADEAGGQSRRLRARSFFLQALSEIAAQRILRATGWPSGEILMCAAGRFVLRGPTLGAEARANVLADYHGVSGWLVEHAGATIRLALGFGGDPGSALEQYDSCMHGLRRAKFRPFAQFAAAGWDTGSLALDHVSPVCHVCRRRKAAHRDAVGRDVLATCSACFFDREIGHRLPTANWMVVEPMSASSEFHIAGLAVTLHAVEPVVPPEALWVFDLTDAPSKDPLYVKRKLARHVPTRDRVPLDFDELADASTGAPYLGVLKMDADSLGNAIRHELENSGTLDSLTKFSGRLDTFFASTMNHEISKPEWEQIYTVFSGGDDLLLVGPWNLMFDYAWHVRKRFTSEFADLGLTISAGLAIVKRKTPIRRGAEQAEQLLDAAKEQGRDRFAAFGQVWEWQHHEDVAQWARCVAMWVRDTSAERGWMQTLLRMAAEADCEPLTTARLVYHVERNYPRANDNDVKKRALRAWIDQIVRDFDSLERVESRYLPAILRYALMATRLSIGDD